MHLPTSAGVMDRFAFVPPQIMQPQFGLREMAPQLHGGRPDPFGSRWSRAIRRLPLVVLVGLSFSTISGCDGSSGEVAVSGHVRLRDGTPLTEGQLVLIPDPFDKDQPQAGATLAEDGSFACRSFTGKNGVLPGQYKVILRFPTGKGAVNPLTGKFKKYTSFVTTPLVLDVPDSGLNDTLLELDEAGTAGTNAKP
jgi:hypothetical protein